MSGFRVAGSAGSELRNGSKSRLGEGPSCSSGSTGRIAPGETLTVMGPSGSGKSSLLAYIGRLSSIRRSEASGGRDRPERSGRFRLPCRSDHRRTRGAVPGRACCFRICRSLRILCSAVARNADREEPRAHDGRAGGARRRRPCRRLRRSRSRRRSPAARSARVALMRVLLSKPERAAARRAVLQARYRAPRQDPVPRLRRGRQARSSGSPCHPRPGGRRSGGRPRIELEGFPET